MSRQSIQVNFWDGPNVMVKEVEVALVEEHHGEKIAAIEWNALYDGVSEDVEEGATYYAYSVRFGIRSGHWGQNTPEEAIARFVTLWQKSGKTLDEGLSTMRLADAESPLPVRGTVTELTEQNESTIGEPVPTDQKVKEETPVSTKGDENV